MTNIKTSLTSSFMLCLISLAATVGCGQITEQAQTSTLFENDTPCLSKKQFNLAVGGRYRTPVGILNDDIKSPDCETTKAVKIEHIEVESDSGDSIAMSHDGTILTLDGLAPGQSKLVIHTNVGIAKATINTTQIEDIELDWDDYRGWSKDSDSTVLLAGSTAQLDRIYKHDQFEVVGTINWIEQPPWEWLQPQNQPGFTSRFQRIKVIDTPGDYSFKPLETVKTTLIKVVSPEEIVHVKLCQEKQCIGPDETIPKDWVRHNTLLFVYLALMTKDNVDIFGHDDSFQVRSTGGWDIKRDANEPQSIRRIRLEETVFKAGALHVDIFGKTYTFLIPKV